MPGAGIDGAWQEVIGYGAHHGWQWGRDVVFTFGPLGFLVSNPYEGEAIGAGLAFNTFLVLAFALGVLAVLHRDSPRWSIGAFALVVFPAAMMGRSAHRMFGLLAALVYFQRSGDAWPLQALILAAAAGVYATVYISSGVLGLGIFLLLDVSRLLHRRPPIFAPVFVLALILSYLSAGQEAQHLPQFLRGSTELIMGYAGAMSAVGGRTEIAGFLLLSSLVFATVLWSEWARVRHDVNGWDALLLMAVVGAHWFVTFKGGFVRHDAHSVLAWQILAMTSTVYAAMRWRDLGPRRVRWSLIGFSMAACVASIVAAEQEVSVGSLARRPVQVLMRQPALALMELIHAMIDPAEWRRTLLEKRTQVFSEIRDADPLPVVDGSVDVIPNVQSAVFAHGLSYRPRPVFQDYTAYTPWLIELNRSHYRSPTAAQYVLFRPETIDNRYPLMDQATAVNELLTLYDPLALEHDWLVLKRRTEALRAVSVNLRESTAMLGQWVSLEPVNEPVLLTVSPPSSLVSWLLTFLFRPPTLALTVRLADGSEQQFRLIEGIARSGFLLSPLIESSLAFAAVATDRWAAVEHLRVVAFRIDTLVQSRRKFYGEAFYYTSALLRIEAGAARGRSDNLETAFRRQVLTHAMATLSPVKAPLVVAQGADLFFHAPAEVKLSVQSASLVRAKFAIRAGAWSLGRATDGVCFRISAGSQDGVFRKLLDRCLDPVSRPEDRFEQSVEVPVGLVSAGTLVFATDCRTNCNWDWSYWTDIDIEP